jgi:hypothetical protein
MNFEGPAEVVETSITGIKYSKNPETGQIEPEHYFNRMPAHRYDARAWAEILGLDVVPCRIVALTASELPAVWWEPIRDWKGPDFYGDWQRFASDEEGKRATVWDYLRDRYLTFPGVELKDSGLGALIKTVRLPPLLDGMDLGTPLTWRLDADAKNVEAYTGAIAADRPARETVWEVSLYRLPERNRLKSCDLAPGLHFTTDDVLPLPGREGPLRLPLVLKSPTPWFRSEVSPSVPTFDRRTATAGWTKPRLSPEFKEGIDAPEWLVDEIRTASKK